MQYVSTLLHVWGLSLVNAIYSPNSTTNQYKTAVDPPYCTISFNSARGGQGDRLDEIWTSAILRVDRGHLPDFGQSKRFGRL